MTTSIVAVLEFNSTGTTFGIVGLPTEAAITISSFLTDLNCLLPIRNTLAFLSAEGALIYVFSCRFPTFGRRRYSFAQVNAII